MSNEIYILTGCRAVYLEADIIFKFKYFVFISRFRYDTILKRRYFDNILVCQFRYNM